MARARADAPWEEVFRLAGAGENEVLYDVSWPWCRKRQRALLTRSLVSGRA